jgi:phosphoribosyl-ATP pyrophosphohydrolase/phosphoribosyl-AMP cyclohydrolase
MLGYMNRKAFEQTRSSGRVTFFSRSRGTLWTKGETSGNFLNVKEILLDCDADTILIKVEPAGPVCHTGTDTCFSETNENEDFLFELEKVICDRKTDPTEQSYTSRLFGRGLNKIAQKFGEEAVELIIEAKDDDLDLFKAEAADVLYHFLVLLRAKDVEFRAVLQTLKDRRSEKEE